MEFKNGDDSNGITDLTGQKRGVAKIMMVDDENGEGMVPNGERLIIVMLTCGTMLFYTYNV